MRRPPVLQPINTSVYDFPTLIREGFVYVDKTALLYELVRPDADRIYFISRPRRFGKSLMISTLEQIFQGNRKLFKGLDIDNMEYDWKTYPILRLDMSLVKADDAVGYRKALCSVTRTAARKLGCDIGSEDNPVLALSSLLDMIAARGERLVVLIDEYDSPISGLLDEPALLEKVRKLLHDFYTVLKVHVGDIRFLMMTGVSKFTKLSVFSGLNNLTDITMSAVYAPLLGYTKEELTEFFSQHIAAFARKLAVTPKEIVLQLMSWYDSYRFSPDSETRVCNPVSIGRALQEQRFYGFWNATGNATLIVERLRKARKTTIDLDGLLVRPEQLDVCDVNILPLESLLYQGGYLTIDHQEPSGLMVLRVPNREVRQALDTGYVAVVMREHGDTFTNSAMCLVTELEQSHGKEETLKKVLTSVFAMVPHEWKLKSEAEAKRYFLLFMRMAGATINAEVESSNGRADAILETRKAIYIFEFKYGKTAKAALKQCRDCNYAAPYLADKREIVYVGVNYNGKIAAVDNQRIRTILEDARI